MLERLMLLFSRLRHPKEMPGYVEDQNARLDRIDRRLDEHLRRRLDHHVDVQRASRK